MLVIAAENEVQIEGVIMRQVCNETISQINVNFCLKAASICRNWSV